MSPESTLFSFAASVNAQKQILLLTSNASYYLGAYRKEAENHLFVVFFSLFICVFIKLLFQVHIHK